MLKYVLLLALVPALAFAQTEGVGKCRDGQPMPHYVNIEGCTSTPCDVALGSTARMKVAFTAPHEISRFTPTVKAGVLGVYIDYALPDHINDGCDFLIGDQRCPIDAGEEVEYEFLFDVAEEYPKIGVTIELTLADEKDVISCSSIKIQVV